MFNLNVSLNGGIDRRGSELDILYQLVEEGMEAIHIRLGDDDIYPYGTVQQYVAVQQKIQNALGVICAENGF
jgi:hypothetical protein